MMIYLFRKCCTGPTFRSLHLHFSQNRLASGFAKYGLFIALQYKMASRLNARKKTAECEIDLT